MVTGVEEYFKILEELQKNNTTLPINIQSGESFFDVDLNDRLIIVPPEFKKYIAVQRDHNIETIYFRVDRYFDTTDLSELTCVVQFTNARKESGIHLVSEKDLTTYSSDGKMILGWKLNRDFTQYPGTVTYSLRFYRLDENKKFIYDLHTIPAIGIIAPGLDTLEDTNAEEDTKPVANLITDLINRVDYACGPEMNGMMKNNINEYFAENPVKEEIREYITNHQVVSDDQVDNAVHDYLTANPPTGGATNVQVEEAVNGYFERNDIDGRINELLIDVNATIGLSPENVTEYIEAHAEIEENCHYNNLGEKVSGDTYQCAKYEVTEGKYKVYGNTNSVANYPLLVQLDENNNVISVYHESDTNTAYGYDEAYSSFVMLPAYEVEILSNTKYLLVNGRVKSGSFSYPPKLEKETVKTSSEKSKDISFNPLYKKKIGLIGDSICYGNGYTGGYGKIIAENNNMTLQNLGVGSTLLTLEIANSTVITSVHGVRTVWTTLTSGAFDASLVDYSLKDDFGNIRYGTRTWNSSTHQYDYTEVKESEWNGTDELYIFRNSIPERLNYIDDDCDYIICEGGINDYLGALYLGTLTDEYDSVLDTHTVLGGTELLCRNLLEKFGAKKIGFIFTHKALNYPYTVSPNADGNLTYYHDEIKKVLRKYSIPVLDLYEVSGLNTGIDAFKKYTYNNDGVHPNKEGYDKFYVPKIEAWMKTL